MLLLAAVLAGCPRGGDIHGQRQAPTVERGPEGTHDPAAPPQQAALLRWQDHLGKCVVVDGYAVDSHKTGPALVHPAANIGLVPVEGSWSAALVGHHVRVEGTVAERSDRPVFVAKKGEPPMQGMPVPEGTDLEQARKRLVIEGARATPLRSTAQIDAALSAQLGKVVTLSGVLWSLNDHWWFQHDGVDIHVEGLTEVHGWSTGLHGRPVALQGQLSRKKLPRIDQIPLKPDRDLADAYLLRDLVLKPHPTWPLGACER
ncbi:MAG: hypothetical protein JRI23_31600 [Deltaproteobacteria bacterium]|jgi:hypothetical protein|nr:hypothetical protein [Deltaproteobacteria bacterium]MBW2536766.1 hypothetical protein [Deltaproteobacteria bacterium]